jgi:hypothetical protein
MNLLSCSLCAGSANEANKKASQKKEDSWEKRLEGTHVQQVHRTEFGNQKQFILGAFIAHGTLLSLINS